ncbi:MAG: hypothetical protein LBR26_07955 [Prevotella sp.]|nr:hypothetical protein [Prevotella sp.]
MMVGRCINTILTSTKRICIDLFSGEECYDVSNEIKADLKDFLAEIWIAPVSMRTMAKTMGVAEVSMRDFIQKMENLFQFK